MISLCLTFCKQFMLLHSFVSIPQWLNVLKFCNTKRAVIMADQQLEDNKIRIRKYLRKHYIQMKYIAICRYCSLQIPCKSYYIKLFIHLKNEHSKVLTEQQKRDQNVHWVWDYFTPITQKRAQCNICNGTLSSVDIINLTRHLDTHRHL